MQKTLLQKQTKAVLMLVPLFFLAFGVGALLMFFLKPPLYYCPLPREMSEMQTPPSFISSEGRSSFGGEEHSEIIAPECEELAGGVTLCPDVGGPKD